MAIEDDTTGSAPSGAPPPATQRDARFRSEHMDGTVIAIPLLRDLEDEEAGRKPRGLHPVIIDLNLEFPGGRQAARKWIVAATRRVIKRVGRPNVSQGIDKAKSELSQQYLFATLEGTVIRALVAEDARPKPAHKKLPKKPGTVYRSIYHIWPDFKARPLINKSVRTVKADAVRISFSASGEGIVWAVLDSGIDHTHRHFQLHRNLEELEAPLIHTDFTGGQTPLVDNFGHGTHVAGIIAGEARAADGAPLHAYSRVRDENGDVSYQPLELPILCGVAPKCKLLSLKVLDDDGDGYASNIIAAIEMIQEINGYGRRLRIHGVNMSVGYEFDPEWFACGQSPLCVEVDRLVRSGVAVVVAAGNTGYGSAFTEARGAVPAGIDLTINDPGNADLAITVGSTHKDMPHIYGVSYFSSKGPTGDGRAKPDIVAPGEKILSCAAGKRREEVKNKAGDCDYLEQSGTSMAAPHVSGVLAVFLSVRREFIGRPESVKEIFLSTATDLKRERYFQGFGLVDLMRAIQSV